jgi:signal transduction histidine kinase
VDHLLPWPLLGIVAAVALAWHIIFMSRFALEALGRKEQWVTLSMLATLIAVGVAYVLADPIYEIITYALLCLPLAAVLIFSAQSADQIRSASARAFFLISLVVAAAALRDFFWVHWSPSGLSHFVVLPQALFLFVLVMGWIMVNRYTTQYIQFHDLNINLEARVAQKEKELSRSFQALESEGQEKAKLLERQRIMQDIHDGVGGHLVSLVNMVKSSQKAATAPNLKHLQEHVQLALDELRMAVDAMQPVDGDLATVLATLRYRLEPRLKSAGISLVWAVDELPLLADLTPKKVLQTQKILLEAMTNVMLHAQASQVTLSARVLNPPIGSDANTKSSYIQITLLDNGVGFDPERLAITGHGLANMKFRAQAIGAQLWFQQSEAGGLLLELHIPTEPSLS